MDIIKEYNKRNNLNYPIVIHSNSSLLILKADKSRWTSRWCFLCVSWESGHQNGGFYKIILKSPKLTQDSQLTLGNSMSQFTMDHFDNGIIHFSLNKSWKEYENFFYEWNPEKIGLFPVFDENATLTAWEVFIFLKESLFANQSMFFRNKLFETIDPKIESKKKLSAIDNFLELEYSTHFKDLWKNELFFLKNNYLDWFKDFDFLWNK